MPGINLSKGGKINLAKNNPGLNNVLVGLSWGENKFSTGTEFDLDVSMFMCEPSADQAKHPAGFKLLSDDYFIFYGKTTDAEGAVLHSGDNKTGNAPGIDEWIQIDLSKLNAKVSELSIVATIHDAIARKQNFGQVPQASIALYDLTKLPNGPKTQDVNELKAAEIGRYQLDDDFSTSTAVQFGSLSKRADGTGWQFAAAGNGYDKGLGDFVVLYGGTLA